MPATNIILLVAAGLLIVGICCAWTAVVVEHRALRREESLVRGALSLWDDNDQLWHHVEALEEVVHAQQIHAENEAEVLNALVERVRDLEDARRPERILALPAPPALKLVDDERGAAPLARELGDVPALTTPTGYVPIIREDLTESRYNRASVEELRRMLNGDRDPGEAITGELVEVRP